MKYLNGVWSFAPAIIQIFFESPFWQTWWFNILTFVVLLFIVYLIGKIRIKQIEEARKQQQEFARQLINAQEIERQRIAAELHDSIGQDLLIIKNRALLGLNQKTNNKHITEQLDEISATATRALDETRAIARNLRPQHLQRFGLTQTLQGMIEQVEKSSQINFQTKIDEFDGLFSETDELSIFRIIQESLNNIVKHSAAKEAKIEITHSAQTVKLFIQDFGKGFEIGEVTVEKRGEKGFGLTSIEQRVKILGGNIKIDSSIGIGTTIIISLNVRNE